MTKAIFIDTTVCTGCRGCQAACKQWHDLPAEETENRGTYQNPPDLSAQTYKLLRMREEEIDGKLQWLFFPDQCRHCVEAPCKDTAMYEEAIYQDTASGAIIYTMATRELNAEEIIESCPYNIPRKAADGVLAKCDLCINRVRNGMVPACVKTCPTGAMNFGSREEMLQLADQRLGVVRKKYPKASLLDPDEVNVIYLVAFDRSLYEVAARPRDDTGLTRQMALRKMLSPITRSVAHIG
jgi:formate dehydrogenase iron-sulfur subunit